MVNIIRPSEEQLYDEYVVQSISAGDLCRKYGVTGDIMADWLSFVWYRKDIEI